MEGLLEFGRGPLFRLSFALMALGLIRIFALSAYGIAEALYRAEDRTISYRDILSNTVSWLFPILRMWRSRPIYSALSFLFHVGLILVPIFLRAHVLLWERGLGFGWWAIPQTMANWLTLLVIVTGPALLAGRLWNRHSRALSRWQDFLWPPLLTVPFLTGYLCTNATLSPWGYQLTMLVHVYAANLIMVLIPFTKIAQCVLIPLSQMASEAAWRLVPGGGDRVAETLGKRGVIV